MFLDLSGYHLTYDQEFSPGAPFTVSPDGNGTMFKTQFDWGGRYNPSNNEAEFYSDPAFGVNPFGVQNGELTITAASTADPWDYGNQPYTSGLITTQNSFSQHGGYFEMRAMVPGKQGLWGAFWMIPTTLKDYPEMDVLEDPNLGPKGQYFLHATAPTDSNGGFVHTGGVPLYKGYHQYGVEWNDQTVTFYFDHHAITEYPTPPQFASLSMYLLVNLAVGGPGSWPGAAPAGSIPAHYRIDYIRVFSRMPSDPAVAQQTVSSPDAVDTTPSYAVPAAPDVVTGTGVGLQQLTLLMSEDFYATDAKFNVLIDGVQQGGLFATIASDHHGQTQNFIFNGSYAPGAHTLTVNFRNPYWGGGTLIRRKLYLHGILLNGSPIAEAQSPDLRGGMQTVSFTVPPAAPAVAPH